MEQGNKPLLSAGQIDLISGIASGIAATLVTHPLDTVKVTIQLNRTNNLTLKQCVTTLYANNGVSVQKPISKNSDRWLL